ncbi:MAG: thioesterase family protein [Ilumatobacteraceae bacterium]
MATPVSDRRLRRTADARAARSRHLRRHHRRVPVGRTPVRRPGRGPGVAGGDRHRRPGRPVHSLHSYFIRPGSPDEPVRFEVERLREGRSFTTRQVVARQSAGAILNLSASFQTPEDEADVAPGSVPDDLPRPHDPAARNHSWGALLERKMVVSPEGRIGYWIRLDADLPDDPAVRVRARVHVRRRSLPTGPLPASRVRRPRGRPHLVPGREPRPRRLVPPAESRRRVALVRRAHHGLSGARGLVTADAWTDSGVHAASIAQQVLLRKKH